MGRSSEWEIKRAREVRVQKLLGLPERRNTKIKCPFHTERTPSMTIYSDGHFHCFGCGKRGGNAIDFLMLLGSKFNEAVSMLNKI